MTAHGPDSHSLIPLQPLCENGPLGPDINEYLRILEQEAELSSSPVDKAQLVQQAAECARLLQMENKAAELFLEASQLDSEFLPPLEELLCVARQGRSRETQGKILRRIADLSEVSTEKARALQELFAIHLVDGHLEMAHHALREALDHSPETPTLWLALELLGAAIDDPETRLKGAMGRAAHAIRPEVRGLLLERIARLHQEKGDIESAVAALEQSLDEVPSLRTYRILEKALVQQGQFGDAAVVVDRTLDALKTDLIKLPEGLESLVNNDDQQRNIHLRGVVYHCAAGEIDAARQAIESPLYGSGGSPSLTTALEEQLRLALADEKSRSDLIQSSTSRAQLISSAFVVLEASKTDKGAPVGLAESEHLLDVALTWAISDRAEDRSGTAAQLEAIAKSCPQTIEHDDLIEQAAVLYFLDGNAEAAGKLIKEIPQSSYRALLFSLFTNSTSEFSLNAEIQGLGADYYWSQIILGLQLTVEKGRLPDRLNGLEQLAPSTEKAEAELFLSSSIEAKNLEAIPQLNLSARVLAATRAHDLVALEQLAENNPNFHFLGSLVVAEYERRINAIEQENKPEEVNSLKLSLAGALARLSNDTAETGRNVGWRLRALFLYLELDEPELAKNGFRKVTALAPSELAFQLKYWLLRSPALQSSQQLRILLQDQLENSSAQKSVEAESSGDFQVNQEEQLVEALVLDLAEQRSSSEELKDALEQDFSSSSALSLLKLLSGQIDENSISSESSRELLLLLAQELKSQAGSALPTARRLSEATFEAGQFHESLTASLLTLTLAKEAARGASLDDYRRLVKSFSALDAHCPEFSPWHDAPAERRDETTELNGDNQELELPQLWQILEAHDLDSAPLANVLEKLAVATEKESPGDPEIATAQLLAAYELINAGDFAKAQALFKKIQPLFASDVTYYYGRLNSSQQLDDTADQIHCLESLSHLLESRQSQAAASYRAGILATPDEGDPQEAERYFTKALERQPDHANAFHQLYRLVKKRGDRLRLIELIDSRLEIDDITEHRQQLLWAKSVYCRNLGRRGLAAAALKELLKLRPEHLAATAMQAELAIAEEKHDLAADALKTFSAHPDLDGSLRLEAGLIASDLLEIRHRPREAVELLLELQSMSLGDSRVIERLARVAARAGEWDLAYDTYGIVAENTDDIKERLRASQIRLAIQRDHLRTFDQLQDAARQVLRDNPLDKDAVDIVLSEDFSNEEKLRLLSAPLLAAREELSRNPLSPNLMKRFSELNLKVESSEWRLLAIGIHALIAPLSERERKVYDEEHKKSPLIPQTKLPQRGLEWLFAPALRGLGEEVMHLIGPALSQCLEPALEALGVSALMKWSPANVPEPNASSTQLKKEIVGWLELVGVEEIDIYVGGSDPHALVFLDGVVPQLVIGEGLRSPLTAAQKARTAVGGLLASRRAGTLLSISPQEAQLWLNALAYLIQEPILDSFEEGTDLFRDQIAPRARQLESALGPQGLAQLKELQQAWTATDTSFLLELGDAARLTAARVATFALGEPSILRQLSENLPIEKQKRNQVLGSVIAFSLSDEFIRWRQFSGLNILHGASLHPSAEFSETEGQATSEPGVQHLESNVTETSDESL